MHTFLIEHLSKIWEPSTFSLKGFLSLPCYIKRPNNAKASQKVSIMRLRSAHLNHCNPSLKHFFIFGDNQTVQIKF